MDQSVTAATLLRYNLTLSLQVYLLYLSTLSCYFTRSRQCPWIAVYVQPIHRMFTKSISLVSQDRVSTSIPQACRISPWFCEPYPINTLTLAPAPVIP